VRLAPYSQLPFVAEDEKLFEAVVRTAFSQRRKTLRNCLRTLLEATTLESLGIDPNLRAENLSIGQYVALANHLAAAGVAANDAEPAAHTESDV
jgi:16S rRNA (adenine1518-N6/adenine1519-N6)-dimethyltransferase